MIRDQAAHSATGVFAAVCGIVRTYELQGLNSHSDYTYDTVSLVLWSASELLVTIICANVPLLRPLYTKVRSVSDSRNMSEIQDPYNGGSYAGRAHSRRRGGGGGSRSHKKGSDSTWTELDDVHMVSTLAAEDGRGTNKTTIAAARARSQESDESILREYNQQSRIRVQADVRVAAERY
jgi:hypothetical protein